MNFKEILYDPYIILLIVTLVLIVLLYYTGGFRVIKKMAYDTTVNPATGLYSMKRLMMWFSFWPAVAICLTQAFVIKIHPVMEFNSRPDTPMWAPVLLFLIALGATAGTLVGHFNSRRTTDTKGNPLTAPYVEPVQPITPPETPLDELYDEPIEEELEG